MSIDLGRLDWPGMHLSAYFCFKRKVSRPLRERYAISWVIQARNQLDALFYQNISVLKQLSANVMFKTFRQWW